MLPVYNTDRLTLRILDEQYAGIVLDFMTVNKDAFERWDSTRPEKFYTLSYQQTFLSAEKRLFSKGTGMRYWIFLKGDTSSILGSVSFSYLNDSIRHCSIGYKLAEQYQGNGYATEAASFLIPLIMSEFDIHRIEADIMPSNVSSLRLIDRLGFHYECIAVKSHEILGNPEDHLRFAYCDI